MKRRFSMLSLPAIVFFFAQSLFPLFHSAWGHRPSCDHASCAAEPAGASAFVNAPEACETCAWIAKLQPPAPAPELRAASVSHACIDDLRHDSLVRIMPDLTAGGARAPPC